MVGDALEGARLELGRPQQGVTWSSEREARSEPEEWSQDGSEWQILKAQLKISKLAINFI